MRLIDADVFDSMLRDAQEKCKGTGGNFRFGVLNSIRENLANFPTVDAAPVRHGRWIEETDRHYHWHCSECLTVQGVSSIRMKYCPECGALMETHPLVAATANPGP